MSRRRNRSRSICSQGSSRPPRTSLKNPLHNSTTISVTMGQTPRGHSCDLRHEQTLYNKNISFFRQNFNQNDTTQLPFMSSLREKPAFKPQTAMQSTIFEPFQASLKTTSNMAIKKNVSDFSANQRRLSGAYYRWHKGSGRNNKWVVNFECNLRDYSPTRPNSSRKEFYPYIKPIHYQDFENKAYNPQEMICKRHHRSFLVH